MRTRGAPVHAGPIVNGRSAGWDLDGLKALRGLNSRLNGITVMTHDQLLVRRERLLAMLSKRTEESARDDGGSVIERLNAPIFGEMIEDGDIQF